MYRLLATDIDDTILAEDGSLPEENHRALEELHRRGITVVLSSGRATLSMQRVAARIMELADDEYLISYNGARVVRAKSGTPVFEWPITTDIIADTITYARDNQLYLQGYRNGAVYTVGDAPHSDLRRRDYEESTGMPVLLTPDLQQTVGDATPKLLIIAEPDEITRHMAALDTASAGRYRVTRSKTHYLEVIHPLASKGEALRHLATELGIGIEETVAAGDNHNDIEMIQAAGLGVAVANAIPELKRNADVVLERTAGEGAIAEIAERFFR